jgi:transposase
MARTARTILPDADTLHLEALLTEGEAVTVVASTARESACCPDCGRASWRVHSRRRRVIADLPWQGLAVRLELRFRRFHGDAPTCERVTFTEPTPTVARRYARRTARLATVVEAVACAVGGEGGARLLAALGIVLSADTALRAIAAAPLPAHPTPRVLGVDDWAKRKGQTYGAIRVDLARHRVVDLLPDRTATTFATWLRDHPGVEVISRDRGGAFAEGGRQGAPAAVQVADRSHLVKNVVEALERVALRHHAALVTAAARLTEEALATHAAAVAAAVLSPGASAAPAVIASAAGETRDAREQAQRRAARVARYERVLALREQGVGVRAIARATGFGRATVRRFLRAGSFPERRPRPPRVTLLTPHEPYLLAQWQAGHQNAAALHRELQTLGFAGSVSLVRDLLAQWRGGPARRGRRPRAAQPQPQAPPPPSPVRAPSPRRAAWLLLRAEAALAPTQIAYRAALEAACPEATTARQLAQEWHRLIRARDRAALDARLAAAEASALPEFGEFAAGVRRDDAAVAAALEHEWSNGQVEGHVNKLKLLKRAAFGRAGFASLRRRVLRATA